MGLGGWGWALVALGGRGGEREKRDRILVIGFRHPVEDERDVLLSGP